LAQQPLDCIHLTKQQALKKKRLIYPLTFRKDNTNKHAKTKHLGVRLALTHWLKCNALPVTSPRRLSLAQATIKLTQVMRSVCLKARKRLTAKPLPVVV
jgi:hypothetical protein